MRDPFGNYVVQKVLETCDDQSLGFILSRIKVHLNTLKRFTYGKHIVARVEKLIATGGENRFTWFTVDFLFNLSYICRYSLLISVDAASLFYEQLRSMFAERRIGMTASFPS